VTVVHLARQRLRDDVRIDPYPDADVVWSAVGGLGLDLGLGQETVTLEILYRHGLTDLDRGGTDHARSRTWSLLAGVAF